jgi:hypothetical protein
VECVCVCVHVRVYEVHETNLEKAIASLRHNFEILTEDDIPESKVSEEPTTSTLVSQLKQTFAPNTQVTLFSFLFLTLTCIFFRSYKHILLFQKLNISYTSVVVFFLILFRKSFSILKKRLISHCGCGPITFIFASISLLQFRSQKAKQYEFSLNAILIVLNVWFLCLFISMSKESRSVCAQSILRLVFFPETYSQFLSLWNLCNL